MGESQMLVGVRGPAMWHSSILEHVMTSLILGGW